MAIGQVLEILPPPAGPVEASPDRRQAEAALGAKLPTDYTAFAETYGAGRIATFLWIFHPASRRDTIDLVTQAEAQRDVLRELADEGEDVPYPLFPEAGGLLPVGMSDNGDVLYWRTIGAPEAWTIVVHEARGPDWWEHDGDLTDFLAAVLSGKARCPIFPDTFPPERIAFEPM